MQVSPAFSSFLGRAEPGSGRPGPRGHRAELRVRLSGRRGSRAVLQEAGSQPRSGVFLSRRFSSDLKRNFHAPTANAEIWITGHEWEICRKIQVRAYQLTNHRLSTESLPVSLGRRGWRGHGLWSGLWPPTRGYEACSSSADTESSRKLSEAKAPGKASAQWTVLRPRPGLGVPKATRSGSFHRGSSSIASVRFS